MEKRSTHKLRSENSDSEWKDIDITKESKVEPLINVPCTPSNNSPLPLIPIMKIDGDDDTSEKVDDRVLNKIQLMEWKDRSNIDRNRQKILVSISANRSIHFINFISHHVILCNPIILSNNILEIP